MMIRVFAVISLLLLGAFAAPGAAPSKSELESMYDKAFREFDAARYNEALRALDAIDARQPGLAESLNLRGVVLMRQGRYDKAEAALRKALSVEPKFWNASFNLAEIPFLKKNWGEARNRFEALMAGESDAMQAETNHLIQYKVLLTFVLQGKEDTVDWILNKFEASKESPALYYSNAAIALQHDNQTEAKEWMDSAEKKFSAPLNKLYAESFYEIGWTQKPAGESRAALEITSSTDRAERLKADAKANFERAERAFQQGDFDGTLKYLDLADAGAPNDAASGNLRGEILMEQRKFDQAEVALQKAFKAAPKFREAQFNLAQIPFKKGEYSKARDRLEALYGATPGGEKNQAAQLIKFKIFLTFLLEGKDSEARQLMDQFMFTNDTPALYYAQAAWKFKHADADQGNDWVVSARKIYSPALNIIFADSFYDLGWLKKPATKTPLTTSALAQADASMGTEPTPAMRLSQVESLPMPDPLRGGPAKPADLPATTPAAVATSTAAVATSAAVAAVTPSSSAAPAPQPKAKPAASPIVATSSAVTLARERSLPTFAELLDRVPNLRALLVAVLLLAGILLLVFLIVKQIYRNLPSFLNYGSSVPLTEPPFAGGGSMASDEREISSSLIETGPPKLSLQLQASEPSVSPIVSPSVAIAALGAVPGVQEPPIASPDGVVEAVSEADREIAATSPPVAETAACKEENAKVEEKALPATPPPREQEEVSQAAAEGSALATDPEVVPTKPGAETPRVIVEAAGSGVADLEKEEKTVESTAPAISSVEEPAVAQEQSVGQGQPIPQLTALSSIEPIMSELTQPEPEFTPDSIAPETAAADAIAGQDAAQCAVEAPSFASEIITTEPISSQPTTPVIMPETTITPAPADRTVSPTMSVQQPAGALRIAVQLTFSLEIVSMQLTPTFNMRGLQLKPTSKVVTMRLAPFQDLQPPINLQATFEVAKIELEGGTIRTVRLLPSGQERPAVTSSSSFAITGLELDSNSGMASVQLAPSHQEQASVHLTAAFQIATIEFSPFFEMAAIVLNSASRNVSLQMLGAGPTSIEAAPVFAIEKVEMTESELSLIQVTPLGSGHP